MNFDGRLFAGRLFAGRLFGRRQRDAATGGVDLRYLWSAPKRWRRDLSADLFERISQQPPEVIASVEALAQKEQISTRRQVAARIEPIAAPDAALIDLYFEFLTLRLQREEEAAIAACIAALV